MTFDATQRAGILTLAGFLAVNGATDGSSPVLRGHAVLTRLLCLTPDPPANVPPPKPPTPGLTTRQRFEEHDMQACTGGCHVAMDPIGFGFEHYDGIGRYRTTDQNLPVDSNGAILLDGKMQRSPTRWRSGSCCGQPPGSELPGDALMRYALNRWDTPADAASILSARTAFQTGGLNIRTLMTGVATSRTFRYRRPPPVRCCHENEDEPKYSRSRDPQEPRHRRRVSAAAVDGTVEGRRADHRLSAALHRHHADRRRLPAEFLPDRRGGPAAGDAAGDAAAARDVGVEDDCLAIREQAAEPDRSSR